MFFLNINLLQCFLLLFPLAVSINTIHPFIQDSNLRLTAVILLSFNLHLVNHKFRMIWYPKYVLFFLFLSSFIANILMQALKMTA